MTAKWEKLCPVDDIPSGTSKKFALGALDLLVIHSGSKFYCCSNECPHLGESLEGGEVHGHVVRCSAHGYKMDVSNGRCLTEGELEIPIFPVEVRDGDVWVKF